MCGCTRRYGGVRRFVEIQRTSAWNFVSVCVSNLEKKTTSLFCSRHWVLFTLGVDGLSGLSLCFLLFSVIPSLLSFTFAFCSPALLECTIISAISWSKKDEGKERKGKGKKYGKKKQQKVRKQKKEKKERQRLVVEWKERPCP